MYLWPNHINLYYYFALFADIAKINQTCRRKAVTKGKLTDDGHTIQRRSVADRITLQVLFYDVDFL